MSDIKSRISAGFLLFIAASILIGSSVMPTGDFFSKSQKETANRSEIVRPIPTLYIVSDCNDVTIFINDANLTFISQPYMVVVTHGWYENTPWPRELAAAMKNKTNREEWLCGWFDWRGSARVIDPREAAQYARDIVGPMLGRKISRFCKNLRHIHLIGHSAGAWVISEAARVIAKETDAAIHLTFLDAYVPLSWQQENLGNFSKDPNIIYWADHYFTRDLTLKVTESILTYAHNVDITEATPGIYDHEFPRYWYPATVIGRYGRGERYEGKKLLYRVETIDYGFSRGLEACWENWQSSIKLPMGDAATQIKNPNPSLIERLKNLFRKK